MPRDLGSPGREAAEHRLSCSHVGPQHVSSSAGDIGRFLDTVGMPTGASAQEQDKQQAGSEDGGPLVRAGSGFPENAEEDIENESEEEPVLKYERITQSLKDAYRNGDAVSSFAVAGDKMVIGSHNGIVRVLLLPSFDLLKVYRAHSASVSHVSLSPAIPPMQWDLARTKKYGSLSTNPKARPSEATGSSPGPAQQSASTKSSQQECHIGTASLDGNVCVQSVLDPKDVSIRDFARPVQAVALSPGFRNDRTYISGGRAGKLVLTQGLPAGSRTKSNVEAGVAAAAGSWLGAVGLTNTANKDRILHSGEGPIAALSWSGSGSYVAWINELGIKVMRSHIGVQDDGEAWRRICHIDRPGGAVWEEMAGSWKATLEWINESGLEVTDELVGEDSSTSASRQIGQNTERLLAGWGDSIWVIEIKGVQMGKQPGSPSSAEVTHLLKMTDCIIAGLAAFTPVTIVLLAYLLVDTDTKPVSESEPDPTLRRRRQKENALRPEVRLININTSDEISVDQLELSRFEGLTSQDYHLGTLAHGPRGSQAVQQAEGIPWLRFADPNRLFSSSASIFSSRASSEPETTNLAVDITSGEVGKVGGVTGFARQQLQTELLSSKLKIFIHSPFDCILATKRDLRDHLEWLIQMRRYDQAWKVLIEEPHIFGTRSEAASGTGDEDMFAVKPPGNEGEPMHGSSTGDLSYSTLQKEKDRVGELWIEQEVASERWELAGEICGKVLSKPSRWEHWISVFADQGRLDLIGPMVPPPDSTQAPGSIVYDTLLMHYAKTDRTIFQRTLAEWSSQFFTPREIINVIHEVLDDREVREDSIEDGVKGRDWGIMLQALIQLYEADGDPRQALRYAMRVRAYDKTMELIGEYHLLDEVLKDLVSLILLSTGNSDIVGTPLALLRARTTTVMQLLIRETLLGTISAGSVVKQLQGSFQDRLVFLYLEKLWRPMSAEHLIGEQEVAEAHRLVNTCADLAVRSFAEYDEGLLMDFLKSSQAYSLEKAIKECERKKYVSQLVYLLSRTGQTKRALNLIIEELDDVSRAVEFAKSQNDAELWDDFILYSLSKPRFVKGLLREAGSGIDPIRLLNRIPDGLEVEGLKGDVAHLLREFDVQASISRGVIRVMTGEVMAHMKTLHKRQRRGLRIGQIPNTHPEEGEGGVGSQMSTGKSALLSRAAPMLCCQCGRRFREEEARTFVGFSCGHVFHMACLGNKGDAEAMRDQAEEDDDNGVDDDQEVEGSTRLNNELMGVGRKVDKIRQLQERRIVCPLEADHG